MFDLFASIEAWARSLTPGGIDISTELFIAILGTLTATAFAILWWILKRLAMVLRSMTSSDTNARRRICGTYSVYHPPLVDRQESRPRKSSLRIYGNWFGAFFAEQIDLTSHRPVYRGEITFFDQHFFVAMAAVDAISKGSSKFYVMNRPYPSESRDNMAIIGFMSGLSVDNTPYSVPVLVTTAQLSPQEAQTILGQLDKSFFSTDDRRSVHDAVAACAGSTDASGFESPWGVGVVQPEKSGLLKFLKRS